MNGKRLFVVFLFILLLFASELKTAFAGPGGMQALLTSWFDGQKEESILNLEEAITQEKEAQMEKLKQELAAKLSEANKELAEFTEKETENRKLELQSYTNELIEGFEYSNEEEKEHFQTKIDQILQTTYIQLEEAKQNAADQKE